MHVHPDKRLAYYSHMRVGSTATEHWLRRRGFIKVRGKHEGPRFRRKPGQGIVHNNRWWWNEPQWDYRWFAGVRNHFDVCLSFKYWTKHDGPITEGWLDEFMYTRYRHFFCSSILYPAFRLLPDCHPIRHERLQADVNDILVGADLEPVSDKEAAERVNRTEGKPFDSYREHLAPDERTMIEHRFAWEMSQFGYEW